MYFNFYRKQIVRLEYMETFVLTVSVKRFRAV